MTEPKTAGIYDDIMDVESKNLPTLNNTKSESNVLNENKNIQNFKSNKFNDVLNSEKKLY